MSETPEEHDRAEQLRRERVDTAADVRLAQALRDQKIDLTLEAHHEEIMELRKGHANTAHSLADLKGQLQTLADTLPQTIMAAIETALEKQTAKALTARQLWLGALAVLVPVVLLLASQGHLHL